MARANLLGQGVRFPPGVDAHGRWAWSSGAANIRESIQIILLTAPEERIMLPGFGAGLKSFLFEPSVTSTHRLIQEAITQALKRWERRIELESVIVDPDPADARSVIATIRYRAVANQSPDAISVRIQLS